MCPIFAAAKASAGLFQQLNQKRVSPTHQQAQQQAARGMRPGRARFCVPAIISTAVNALALSKSSSVSPIYRKLRRQTSATNRRTKMLRLLFGILVFLLPEYSICFGQESNQASGKLTARILAVGIPGASAVAPVGTFHKGGPIYDKPEFASFTQPGQILDPKRIL
jgi:hypothetical protein